MSSQTTYPSHENCESVEQIAEKNIFETEAIIKMVEETLRHAATRYPDQASWCDWTNGGCLMDMREYNREKAEEHGINAPDLYGN
jgi:hypothetical protein